MFARPRSFLHSGTQVLIGGVDVEKLSSGHKVALDVMYPVFDPLPLCREVLRF